MDDEEFQLPNSPAGQSADTLWQAIGSRQDSALVKRYSVPAPVGVNVDGDEEEDAEEDPQEDGGFSFSRFGRALGRGAAKAVNETVESTVGAGQAILKGTGAYKLVFNEEEEEFFLDWYEGRTKAVTDELIDVQDERDTGIYGLAETISQVGVGLLSWGKVLQGAQWARRLTPLAGQQIGRVGRAYIAGALTDGASFDAYESRLSNIVEDGPEWMSNPLTRFLAADEDDSEAVARVKAAFEGVLTGAAVDGLIQGLRFLKARRAVRNGTQSAEEAAESVAKKIEEDVPSAPEGVIIEELDDGTYSIRLADEAAQEVGETASERFQPLNVKSRGAAESVASSMSMMARRVARQSRKAGTVSPEQVEAATKLRDLLADGSRSIEEIDPQELSLNPDYFVDLEDSTNLMVGFANVIQDALLNRSGRVKGFEDTSAHALRIFSRSSEEGMVELLKGAADVQSAMDAIGHAARLMTGVMSQRVNHLANLAAEAPNNPLFADMLHDSAKLFGEVFEYSRQIISGGGRTLNVNKMKLGPEELRQAIKALNRDAQEAAAGAVTKPGRKHLFHGMTRQEIRDWINNLRLVGDDPEAVYKMMQYWKEMPEDAVRPLGNRPPMESALGIPGRIWERALYLRTASMLSGIGTQTVNLFSTALHTAIIPAEMMWAGIRLGGKEGAALRMQAAAHTTGLLRSFFESAWAGVQAFKRNVNILDPVQRADEGAGLLAQDPTTFIGRAAQTVVGIPTRGLMSGDEFLKQLNYRASLIGRATRKAAEDGITDPQAVDDFVESVLRGAFDSKGAARNMPALETARFATHTQKLEDGLGKVLLDGANKVPQMRILFPFIRTPTQILRRVQDRTPGIAAMAKRNQEMLAAGGEVAQLVKARQEIGGALYATGILAAMNGLITHRGPSDPVQRKVWLENNEPYSIKVGDRFVPISRMEPLSMPLMLMADAYAAFEEVSVKEAMEIASVVAVTLTNAVANRTYFMDLAGVMEAITSQDERAISGWEAYFAQLGQSFIPNLANQMNPDDTFREARTFMDEVLQRTWPFSDNLEPRRGFFGEPVKRNINYLGRSIIPFAPQQIEQDPVVQAIVDLKIGFPPPGPEQFGVDWTDRDRYGKDFGASYGPQSPYDYMMERVGTITAGEDKLTLRQAIEKVVLDPDSDWHGLSSGTPADPGGPKADVIRSIRRAYEQAAIQDTFAKYADVLLPAMQADQIAQALSFFPEEKRQALQDQIPDSLHDEIEHQFGALDNLLKEYAPKR